jgi:gas vesicle structural protein
MSQVLLAPMPPVPTRRPLLSEHAELVEALLERGIVLETNVQLSVLGLDLVGVRARVVVASLDAYLRYADALLGLPPP